MKTEGGQIHILTGAYSVIDPHFGHDEHSPIELDLGCGKGGFTIDLARRNPESLVLAADIMLGRLRKVMHKRDLCGVRNLELLRAANFDLIAFQLPPACITRVHLLCPDPWPKPRHRGKRLASGEFLLRLRRILQPNGVFHFSSDEQPYVESVESLLENIPDFIRDDAAIDDVRDIQTEFEKRWLKQGKHVRHLAYRLFDAV